jgi:hypothetical protein
MKIYFCSAPCGSGKTYQIIKRACEWAKLGRRVIVLQPTKELIDKTVQEELLRQPNPPKYNVFHGGTVAGFVAARLTDYLKEADDEGQIIFATHQVLPYVRFWANQDTWHVFIDEALQVHRHHSYKVPDTHGLITELIILEPYNSLYSLVTVADEEEMERIARNINHDQIYEEFREFSQTLRNQHWDSFVDAEKFEKLKDGKQGQLSVHSILMSSVLDKFKSVTIVSANFTDKMMYRLWSAQGVKFKEDQALTSSLQFREHQNSHLITIKYADERSWSKCRRVTKLDPAKDEETTVMDAIVQAAKATFSDKAFVWQANKDVPDTLFNGAGDRLPNAPHGLNCYSHIDNVVFLSSLNPAPDHFRFLETQGITGEEVRRAIYYETVYQSAMRTSIRDLKNIEPKTVVVPDISAAQFLNGLLPGSRIEKVETNIPKVERPKTGRPRKHQSDKERKAQYRQRQKQKLLNELFQLKEGPYAIEEELGSGRARVRDEMGIRRYTCFVPEPLTLTVYRDVDSNSNPAGYVDFDNFEGFCSLLKSLHDHPVKSKEANFLMSPAIFDPNHPDREGNKRRGLKNIRYLRHIWFDFENGKLMPEDVPELFPLNQMVIFNTYNHTADAPRFRVIFPTSQIVNTEAYEAVWDNFAAKLRHAGYTVGDKDQQTSKNSRPSGLDVSKRSAASVYYAPCQAKNPADSFFRYYDEAPRQLLDPVLWLANSIVPFRAPFISKDRSFNDQRGVNQQKVNLAAVEEATKQWHQSRAHPGTGNDSFFNYALSLRSAGMSLDQIERKLEEQAQYGRSPAERRSQISSIMQSLQKAGQKSWLIFGNPYISASPTSLFH